MQAVVSFSENPGSVELRDVPNPELGPGQVLVEVMAVGVCGSDLHAWKGPVSWPMKYPVILGHEFSGVVNQVSSGVEGWHVGDRVTCETHAEICGVCAYCRTGNYNVCPKRRGFGAVIDGAMGQFIAVRPEILHRIPEGISFEEAALTEPAAVGFNAVHVKSKPVPGDVVVVIGPGPIGLTALQMALLSTPSHSIAVGLSRDERRLETALELGADTVIRADQEDPVESVREITADVGADLIIDAVGIRQTLLQSMEMVRPNGQITKIGWGPEPIGFSIDPLVAKGATLQGSFSHTWTTWERVLRLLERGKINLAAISKSFPMESWREAFQEMDGLSIAKAVLIP